LSDSCRPTATRALRASTPEKNNKEILQRDSAVNATRYVSKSVLCFTRYESQKGFNNGCLTSSETGK